MAQNMGVICEVSVRDKDHEIRSVGPHKFLSVPRVGEIVIADYLGEEAQLRVKDVLHIGLPTDRAPAKIATLEVVEVHLTCEKV